MPVTGISRGGRQLNGGAVPKIELGGAGVVKVYYHTVGIGSDGERGDERDAARAAGKAAVAVEGAAVRLLAFHLHVISPGRAVAPLGAK